VTLPASVMILLNEMRPVGAGHTPGRSIPPEGTAMASMHDSPIASAVRAMVTRPLTEGELESRVRLLNELRALLHELGPFSSEPVDLVEWVPIEEVEANDYNPNAVAPPEMELLRLSIMADGYTQPIVTNREDGTRIVIDGFHRNRVGRECPDVAEKIQGHLPVVQIRTEQTGRADRMASTIRHNRARGKHQVVAMSEIVLELKRRNWSDEKISKQLGMDTDEVLRLTQVTGLAIAFKDRDFSEAWEAVLSGEDEDALEVIDNA
jgi:ParB-like chromosome segregation protein Spo0J